jgi:hypothetical protein
MKRFLSCLLALSLVFSSVGTAAVYTSGACAPAENSESQIYSSRDTEIRLNKSGTTKSEILAQMLERAEAFVNYEWVPSTDIAVWNENPYNGKMYFPAGETVKGVPYTLFFSELNVDSLLSLEEYKSKASINYSTTAFCTSMNEMRTGPVYGSCCATFVSEVFGGNFVNGISPKYDSVPKIINSGYCETTYGVKATDIEAGDALSNISGKHIVWVGEVTDSYITIYEETPPVARKVTLPLDEYVYSDGYLHYGDSENENSNIYNVVTKSNELSVSVYEVDPVYERYGSFIAYPCVTANFEVFKSDLTTHGGEIYIGDKCTIIEVYTNDWCKVNYPLTGGGTKTAYTPISNFVENPKAAISSFTSEEYIELFPTKSMGTRIFRIYPNDVCYYFGTAGTCTQLFMPHNDGYYVLGWADISKYASDTEPALSIPTTLSVTTLPDKTTYEIGEALDTTGLSLLLLYSDNSSVTITDGYTVSGFDSSTAGTKSITVTYGGKTTSFNVTVNSAAVDESSAQITVDSARATAGQTVQLCITLKNNPGIAGLTISLDYDKTVLTLATASNGSLFDSFTSAINFMWDSANNVTADGTLATFTFNVNENAEKGDYSISNIVRSCVNEAGEDVALNVIGGKISVIDFKYGDANGDEKIDMKDVVLLRQYIVNYDYDTNTSSVSVEPGADANADGKIDTKDVVILRQYIVNFDYDTGSSTIILGPQ